MTRSRLRLTQELVDRVARVEPDEGYEAHIEVFSETDYDEHLAEFLTPLAPGDPVWVFAYGSLMWKPGFAHVETRRGVAEGWQRSFCLRIARFRGTRAQPGLMPGLVGAVAVGAYDPERPETAAAGAIAQAVGTLVTLRYGRDDELESDEYGVRLSAAAGYDPRAMIRVMEILRDASGERGGPPEFFSTHPDPGNRIERIHELVRLVYPNGVPTDLRE